MALLLFGTIMITGCGDNSTGIDFSTVPPPFDTSNAVSDTTFDNGLRVYTIEEGDGVFTLTENDFAIVHFTARTAEGDPFDSSYLNGSTRTRSFTNLTPVSQTGITPNVAVPPLLEGLRLGILGMVEGEKRTVEIPPELGFQQNGVNRSQLGGLNMNGFELAGKPLVIDVELIRIQ